MAGLNEILAAKQQRIDVLHRCQPGRTALLVIDMQRGFLEPGAALEVPAGREIVPNVRRLIDVCREKHVPVIFTQFVCSPAVPCLRGDPFGIEHLPPQENAPTGFGHPSGNCLVGPEAPGDAKDRPNDEVGTVPIFAQRKWDCPLPQSGSYSSADPNSADIVPELAPRADELVVQSHVYDKFFDTPLDLALRSRDIRYLILTGVVTDVCVNATLMSAATRDYRVTAVTNGVATLWPELQEACFAIWSRKFARLRRTEEVVEELAALTKGAGVSPNT